MVDAAGPGYRRTVCEDAESQASATEKAERLVRDGLRRLGGTEAELAVRRKEDRAKLELATPLRAETTMTRK